MIETNNVHRYVNFVGFLKLEKQIDMELTS
jgi:hypothetical protein